MQPLAVDHFTGQTLGNYRIERFLGQGRLNAIYLVRNLVAQRLDALTLYSIPERFSSEARTRFLLRFRKEAAAICSLNHPHILPVYEYGELAGNPYLVTPYALHGSLGGLLKQRGAHDHNSTLSILKQLVAGLAHAHRGGFIHGTLRPSTVVCNPDNTLRVAGFGLMHMLQLGGIERIERETPYTHLLSIAETLLVSPEYVAPEIIESRAVDTRSDIYALGCILFELLSGQPPFIGKSPLDTINKHVTEAVRPLHAVNPRVPLALASVVNQALERDPARRFQHVSELVEAFTQASRGAATSFPNLERDTPPAEFPAQKWQLVPPIVTGRQRTGEQEAVFPNLALQGSNVLSVAYRERNERPLNPLPTNRPSSSPVITDHRMPSQVPLPDCPTMIEGHLPSFAPSPAQPNFRPTSIPFPDQPTITEGRMPIANATPNYEEAPRKINRRKVLLLLAGGGAAAAACAGVMNITKLGHLFGHKTPKPTKSAEAQLENPVGQDHPVQNHHPAWL